MLDEAHRLLRLSVRHVLVNRLDRSNNLHTSHSIHRADVIEPAALVEHSDTNLQLCGDSVKLAVGVVPCVTAVFLGEPDLLIPTSARSSGARYASAAELQPRNV